MVMWVPPRASRTLDWCGRLLITGLALVDAKASDLRRCVMRYMVVAFCLGLTVLLAGCSGNKSPDSQKTKPQQKDVTATEGKAETEGSGTSAKDVRQEVSEAKEAVAEFSQQKTQQALQNSQKSLDEAKKKVAELKEKLGKMKDSAQQQSKEAVEKLDKSLQDAEDRLAQLRDASGDAWSQAQDNLQKALANLKAAHEEASAAFEKAMAVETEDSKKTPDKSKQ